MPKTDETFGERFRKITWLQWGLICLAGAGFSQSISLIQGPPANRAEAAGRGAAGLLFVVIGLALIVLHFVRPKGGGKGKTKAKAASPPGPRRAGPPAGPPGLPPRRPGAKQS